MGTKLSPRGDHARASQHTIQIPRFFNFRLEDGRYKADMGWKPAVLSPEDYLIHTRQNISDRLTIIQNMPRENSIFPYEFEHLSDHRPNDILTVNENMLGGWVDKVANADLNTANALLLESLGDAQDEIVLRKSAAIQAIQARRAAHEFDPAI